MVRMTDIWDRTAQVLRGRLAMLATIAALLIFLPTVIQAGVQFFTLSGETSVAAAASAALAIGLLGLLLLVVRLWGNAAIVAAGSDPMYDQQAAIAHGARRLGPVIGITLVLGLAAALLVIPFVALIGSGLDWIALAHGQVPAATAVAVSAGGRIAGAGLYILLVFILVVFTAVRLVLLVPVIVNERLGLGAIGRAWRLTRGLFWRVFGVLLLFGIVFFIASLATTSLLSLLARLLLGGEHLTAAVFIGQVGAGVIAAAYAVVTGVFTAQLYRALTGREAAEAFA